MIAFFQRSLSRLTSLLRKRALDADLNTELEHHLELGTQRYLAVGLAPEEARRRAQIDLGGIEQIHESHRDARTFAWIGEAIQDLAYAGRVFSHERSFTVVVLLILAIGMGLNIVVFSLVNTVLLRPLPFSESKRLVWIYNGEGNLSPHNLSAISSSIDTWEGLESQSQSLERIEAYNPFAVRSTWRLTGTGEPESVLGGSVSTELFSFLGLQPERGRLFIKEDGEKNAPLRVLLSHALWARRFQSDPNLVGRTIQLNGEAVEVIGIMPAQDRFAQIFSPALPIDFYFALNKEQLRLSGNSVALIGRMKPGIEVNSVRSDLARALERLKQQFPSRGMYYFANVTSLDHWVVGSLRAPLAFLWVAAGLMLAIVGFTFGGLLLARGIARRKELALRSALGAGRARLLRQLLTEVFALSAVGSLFGASLAYFILNYIAHRSSIAIPLLQSVQFDLTALLFTAVLCLGIAVACGLSPSWRLLARDRLQAPLNEEGRGSSGGRAHTRLRSSLVVLELALACVLVILSGLMTRSFINLVRVDWGFDPRNLLALRVDPLVPPEERVRYLEELLTQVRALPGVESAALTDCIPIERDRSWGVYPFSAHDPSEPHWAGAHVRIASPGLFATMRTQFLAGSDFSNAPVSKDEAEVIVNEALARTFWPNESALGKYIKGSFELAGRVVGVVQPTRHSGPDVDPGNEIYLNYRQVGSSSWDLIIRTSLPAVALSAQLSHLLRQGDPTLPMNQLRPLSVLVNRSLSSRRLMIIMVITFASIAVSLALFGVYQLISYTVQLQRKEIGIRMALGAEPAQVRRQIVTRTFKLAVGGIAAGALLALVSAILLRSLLYGIAPSDPITFVAVTILLLISSVVAGLVPAIQASAIDPLIALREG